MHLVVDVDLRQAGTDGCDRPGVEPRDLDPERLAPSGQPVGAPLEHDAVVAGDVEEVDVGVETGGVGPHARRGAHPTRVPV